MKTRKGYTVYPLTVAQKFHFFYLDACENKAVVNIGTSLTIETELDFDVLRECIIEAYNRSESMRLMFAKDKDGTWYQYVNDKAEPEVPFVDFSDKTMEEAEQTMREWTGVPMKRQDSLMSKIVMIKMPDGYSGVYLLSDHVIMDEIGRAHV